MTEDASPTPEPTSASPPTPTSAPMPTSPPIEVPSPAPASPPRKALPKRAWWINWVVVLLVIGGLYLVFHFRLLGSLDPKQNVVVGKCLLELEAHPLLDAPSPVRLAELQGRVVLVSFWAPHRLDGAEVIVPLATIVRRFRDAKDFQCVSIAYDPDSARPKASAAVKKPLAPAAGQEKGTRWHEDPRDPRTELHRETEDILRACHVQMPVYYDPGSQTRKALEALSELSLEEVSEAAKRPCPLVYPTTLVLDRQGTICGLWIGVPPDLATQMETILRPLLEEGK